MWPERVQCGQKGFLGVESFGMSVAALRVTISGLLLRQVHKEVTALRLAAPLYGDKIYEMI